MKATLLKDWYYDLIEKYGESGELTGDHIMDKIRDDAGQHAVEGADYGYYISNGDIVVFSVHRIKTRIFVEELNGALANKFDYIAIHSWKKDSDGRITRGDSMVVKNARLVKLAVWQILKDLYVEIDIDNLIEMEEVK